MKRAANQKADNKSGTKRTAQNSRSSVLSRKPVARNGSIKAHRNIQPASASPQGQPKSDLTFAYKLTDDGNVLAIIEAVRTGISFTDFNEIAKMTPFSLAEWAVYLQLSERTIQRNQKELKAFQPIQSERIIELIMLYDYGVDVFGDKGSFNVWLTATSVALGGRTPKELLDTKFGIGMVKDELGRIEHGILA